MRFAIACGDRYLGVFRALLEAGWQALEVFTTPVDGLVFHNDETIALAGDLKLPVQMQPIGEGDLQRLSRADCDVLVVASYSHRIGDWSPWLPHAINFHPSPLPLGQGPWPLVRAIQTDQRRWGVSCHRLSPPFDAGPVLASESFDRHPGESHDVLDLRVQMALTRLARRVAVDFRDLWSNAIPQTAGEYWSFWSESERWLDFAQAVSTIEAQMGAFGTFGLRASIASAVITVRRVMVWQEAHSLLPGTLAHRHRMTLVIAARDGYVAITDWSPEAPPVG